MRKVYIELKAKLIIQADEGVEIDEVISEMEYDFISQTDGAEIIDTRVDDYEITDSK